MDDMAPFISLKTTPLYWSSDFGFLSSLNSKRWPSCKKSNLSNLDDRLTNQLKIIDTIALESSELIRELNHYLQNLEINEDLKKEVEFKIQATFNFCRKYRIKPEDLENLSDEWQSRYELLAKLLDEKGISEALNEARKKYDNVALKLSKKRSEFALKLNKIITEKLKHLSFTHGRFEVNLNSIKPSINGNEQVEFLISTYLNAEPKPIQKVASGGELSRISLAIRVASITKANVPVMIFDEVDYVWHQIEGNHTIYQFRLILMCEALPPILFPPLLGTPGPCLEPHVRQGKPNHWDLMASPKT